MDKQPAIYMMANRRNGTIYVGVTSQLPQRAYQHKNSLVEGFTKKHDCKLPVYYAIFNRMDAAITEEKRLKAGSRKQKLELIEATNPTWRDLSEDFTL